MPAGPRHHVMGTCLHAGGRRRYSWAGAKGFNANRRRSRAVLYHLSGHLQKQSKSKHKLSKVRGAWGIGGGLCGLALTSDP